MRDQRQRRARRVAALVALGQARARPGLRLVVDGEDAVAERKLARDRKIDQRARRLHRHDVEMEGLAPDHAAERDHAVIGLLRLLGGIDRDRDRRRDFERARHGDDVIARAGLVERLRSAGSSASAMSS